MTKLKKLKYKSQNPHYYEAHRDIVYRIEVLPRIHKDQVGYTVTKVSEAIQ